MKKSDFILIGIVVIFIIFALVSSKGNEVLEEVEYPLALVGDAGLHQISYDEYTEFVEDGEAFIVVIERAGCGFCVQYMPIVEEVAKEKKIPIYYIDTDTLTNDEFLELSKKNSYLRRNKDWGTPTTLFMLGNRVLDVIGGYDEKDAVLSFLDGRVIMGE